MRIEAENLVQNNPLESWSSATYTHRCTIKGSKIFGRCTQEMHASPTTVTYDYINSRLHRLPDDYLDYLPRLVSTRKLVEDGSRGINN
jgi:hypothetical protein